jgi:hypothetical protein
MAASRTKVDDIVDLEVLVFCRGGEPLAIEAGRHPCDGLEVRPKGLDKLNPTLCLLGPEHQHAILRRSDDKVGPASNQSTQSCASVLADEQDPCRLKRFGIPKHCFV